MARILLVFALLAVVAGASAQPVSGKKFELSISGSYQSFSSSADASNSSSISFFTLSPRVGYFLVQGLEFEPEATLVLGQGSSAYALNGNFSYNFVINKKDLLFLLAGYGVANCVPMNQLLWGGGSSSNSLGVLNLGGGLKIFLNENVAMRVEYRYQRFTGSEQPSYIWLNGGIGFLRSTPVTYSLSSVLVGFSIFP